MFYGNTLTDVSSAVSMVILKPAELTVKINHRSQGPWFLGILVQTLDLSLLLALSLTTQKTDDDGQLDTVLDTVR